MTPSVIAAGLNRRGPGARPMPNDCFRAPEGILTWARMRRVAQPKPSNREELNGFALRTHVLPFSAAGRSHLGNLGPNSRDRLAAGVIVPVAWAENAERVRKWVRQIAMGLFENFDILVAPSTPCVATELGRDVITIGGLEVPARGSLGQYTQPLSLLGAPIVGAPLPGPSACPRVCR